MTAAPVSITGPASLVEAVPYLLGFTPADSLVLVGLRDRRVSVTARLDLADATDRQITDVLHVLATKGESTAVVALTYAADADPSQIAAAADAVDITVAEHLRVHEGRYWSLTCPIEGCCPTEGTPIPAPGTVAAEFIVQGNAPAASRAELAAQLEPTGDPDRLVPLLGQAQRAADDDLTAGRAAARTASDIEAVLAAAARTDLNWSDAQLARYAVALTRNDVRDAAWMAIDNDTVDGRELFAQLARCLPSSHRAPALFLFAWKTWRTGNGALAAIAVDRVLEADPTYGAGHLLQAALTAGVDPRRAPRISSHR